ncbi:hypothetical protein HDU87_006506, partial [Geranomyces variabilis]
MAAAAGAGAGPLPAPAPNPLAGYNLPGQPRRNEFYITRRLGKLSNFIGPAATNPNAALAPNPNIQASALIAMRERVE